MYLTDYEHSFVVSQDYIRGDETMGWTGRKIGEGVTLFTRGGLNSVYVSVEKDHIEEHMEEDVLRVEIPDNVLIGLAADYVRSRRISWLEDASDEEILK